MVNAKQKVAPKKSSSSFAKRHGLLLGIFLVAIVSIFAIYKYKQRYDSGLVTIYGPAGPGGASVTETRAQYKKDQQAGGIEIVDGNILHPCAGNLSYQCKAAPSIDFYPTGSEDATNPDYKEQGVHKEIMGRLTTASGNKITLKTTTGSLFFVTFPIDPIANFNFVRKDTKVAIGDMLHIDYVEPSTAHDTNIGPSQIFMSSLLLKNTNVKTDPSIEKY